MLIFFKAILQPVIKPKTLFPQLAVANCQVKKNIYINKMSQCLP